MRSGASRPSAHPGKGGKPENAWRSQRNLWRAHPASHLLRTRIERAADAPRQGNLVAGLGRSMATPSSGGKEGRCRGGGDGYCAVVDGLEARPDATRTWVAELVTPAAVPEAWPVTFLAGPSQRRPSWRCGSPGRWRGVLGSGGCRRRGSSPRVRVRWRRGCEPASGSRRLWRTPAGFRYGRSSSRPRRRSRSQRNATSNGTPKVSTESSSLLPMMTHW